MFALFKTIKTRILKTQPLKVFSREKTSSVKIKTYAIENIIAIITIPMRFFVTISLDKMKISIKSMMLYLRESFLLNTVISVIVFQSGLIIFLSLR